MNTYQVNTTDGSYILKAGSESEAYLLALKHEGITIEDISESQQPFEIIDIRSKLPFIKSNGKMNKEKINTVVIHHDGQHRPDIYDSVARYDAQARYHISKDYNHISYHYIIDNVGDVFQCLDENEVAWHCGNYWINKKSIAIKFDGNMDTQELTDAQLVAYNKLMRYLTTERPDLPKVLRNSVKGHRAIKATSCPGHNTLPYIDAF